MPSYDLQISELSRNKTPRIPVCFCIELPAEGTDRAEFNRLTNSLNRLVDKFRNSDAFKYSTDYCIITFRESVYVQCDFGEVMDGELSMSYMPGKPNLKAALLEAYKRIRIRLKSYDAVGRARKGTVLFVLSSGATSEPLGDLASQISYYSNTHGMEVIPFVYGNGDDSALQELTVSGVTYRCVSGIDKVFDLLGKSIQSMSESSARNMLNLGESAEWDSYRKKG